MKRLALLAALPAVSITVTAGAATPHLWAVQGLYGLERSACGSDGSGNGETAMIAPVFCSSLDLSSRQRIGSRFVAAMAAHFPAVETRFAASFPADATPRARLAGSLIASLRLSRATIWRIDKQVGTDAFLPITLTLDITNAATGEVVFSRTRSQVAQGSYATREVDRALAAQFADRLDATMQSLVVEAAADWRPSAQTATIVGRTGDDWIVDRGRAQGLRTGDSIGEDGHITYAGASYAIVHPTLSSYSVGQALTRTIAAPVEMLARPSVLTVLDVPPEGYASPYLTTIFEEALGAHAGLSSMPINPSFVSLRTLALGEAHAASNDSRSLPDYVAVVQVALLPSVNVESNIPGVTIERHDARAYVTLVDRSGRAVFAVQGVGRITDQVSGNIRFSSEQRQDTAIRNALIDAAGKLATFRPQPLMLPIARSGGRMMIADPGGALSLGRQVVVLHEIGSIGGVNGPVLVPVGQVTTQEVTADGITADDADIKPITLHANDVVAIEQAGPALQARRPVMQCLDATGHAAVENRGSVSAPFWAWAAAMSFAGHFRAPVEIAGLSGRLAAFSPYFEDWDRFAPANLPAASLCFTPVMAVTSGAPSRRGATYTLTAGYALMRGGAKVGGGGMQTALTPTAVPAGTPDAIAAAMLQQDLADQLPPLADRAAAALPTQM